MPSSIEYERNYYSTTYSELDTIPLKEGNVIAIYDADGFYYDVGNPAGSGQNVIRRKASGIEVVGSLSEAREEPNTIFVVNAGIGTDEEGNSYTLYSGYCWDIDNEEFYEVFNNLHDFQVKSIADASTQAYIVGSTSSSDSIGTLIKNPNIYLTDSGDKIHADLEGNADSASEASHAAEATLATRAKNDNAPTPKPITGYLNDAASDATTNLGSTITFTRGDGTTKAIRVSDTTYDVFTDTTAGLVDGTNNQVSSDPLGLVLSGSGWIDVDDITFPSASHADSADADGLNQNIAETYVKSATYNTTDQELTLILGDDTQSTPISIPNTTYNVFSASEDGLVPAASAVGDTAKFLRGDATWQTIVINDYQGATPSAPGVHGLVPAAASGEIDKYLRSDGTWQATSVIAPDYQGATISTAGVHGLVPAASIGDTESYLGSDGAWHGNFTDVAPGLVPPSGTTDPTYSLKADGTWSVCDDTKNTAGAGNDVSHKLFLVGAQSQSSEAQTYSNVNIYVDSNKLYSNSVEVVNLSDSQALTNKSYEGYTLGSACEKSAASSVIPDDNIPTNNAVISYTNTRINQVRTLIGDKLDSSAVAPKYNSTTQESFTGDGSTTSFALTNLASGISEVRINGEAVTSGYTLDSVNNAIVFTTAPANDDSIVVSYTTQYKVGDWCIYETANGMRLYKCTTAITTAETFDPAKWQEVILANYMGIELTGTLSAGSTSLTISDSRITTNAMVDVYTSVYGVNPTDVAVSAGQIVLTFAAQSAAINVKVVVKS